MQEKSVTLTPNKRLAMHLQQQFCATTSKQNQLTWHSAKILPLKTWLVDCWQDCRDQRILLTPYQEILLWQKTINQHLGEEFITLTNLVISAYKLTENWQLEHNNNYLEEEENATVFVQLYKKFRDYCQDQNLVTINELPKLLSPYLANYNFKQITFAGFDEYNPQLQKLITTIESTGSKIIKTDPNNCQNSTQKRLSFDHLKQELVTSANWAKKIIDQDNQNSIGIIVPNLVELRPKILQIFTEIFSDHQKINIAAGTPLTTIPIIKAALELLSLALPLSINSLMNLLSSPYIAGADQERSERALVRAALSKLASSEISLDGMKNLAIKYKKNIPMLITTLQNWQTFYEQLRVNKPRYSYEWTKTVTKLLSILGYPGEANLTEIETTAIHHLTKSLHEVAAARFITGKISYKKVLQLLQESILPTRLPIASQIDAPISILGTLEATGINFDHLWIMGLDQNSFPPTPQPNPFIPIEIQKKFSLPHSSAERELHFCNTLIKRYKRSAKKIIFSYVRQDGERTIEPSPLIMDLPEIAIKDLELTPTIPWEQKIYWSRRLETITDDLAPKLLPHEITHAGSRLIELQSLCPFKALMEFRLKTQEPEKSEPGVSKTDRGRVIHHILEQFWQKIKTQRNLYQLSAAEIQKLLEPQIEHSLKKLDLPLTIHRLEKQCLLPLITRWLEIEKTRSPFKVVVTEKTVQIELAAIPLKLRIDRIDQLEDGSLLLIDYKTGKNLPAPFDWFGKRPKNLQLPLYSIAINSIQGLALAKINLDALKFKEISLEELEFNLHTMDTDVTISNNKLTWSELINYWHDRLTKIAADFASGIASPTPISPQTCKQCSFGPACRVTGC